MLWNFMKSHSERKRVYWVEVVLWSFVKKHKVREKMFIVYKSEQCFVVCWSFVKKNIEKVSMVGIPREKNNLEINLHKLMAMKHHSTLQNFQKEE
jgi:hypothetical protein